MEAGKFVFCLLSFLFAIPLYSQEYKPDEDFKLRLSESSKLKVFGTTNVNEFTCELNQINSSQELLIESKRGNGATISQKAILSFPVQEFDCKNNLITRDFRNALNYKEFPNIILNISHLKQDRFNENGISLIAEVELTISGQKKQYQINFNDVSQQENHVSFRGEKRVRMTDFKITPPTALFGLIKVDDEIAIDFELQFEDQ